MKGKWRVPIILALSIMMLFASSANAASVSTNPAQASQTEIPEGVKNLSDLLDYLREKGTVKNFEDMKTYMLNNKQVIFKLSPNLIDYGFTTRLYLETNTPSRDDGVIKITHDYGTKEARLWVVPFIISNNTDKPLEISKENFALVPKNIPAGYELSVLAIDPEYIMDGSKGVSERKILGKFELPPQTEVHLNAVFHVFTMTSEQSVNLRVFDGKDHADVNIAKP